jgi:hypothetical protein
MMWAGFLWSVLYSGMCPRTNSLTTGKKILLPSSWCKKMRSKQRARNMRQAWKESYLLSLFFDPEDGGSFLGNVTALLPYYTASNSTRQTLLTVSTVRNPKSLPQDKRPGVLYNSLTSWLVLTLHTPCSVTGFIHFSQPEFRYRMTSRLLT